MEQQFLNEIIQWVETLAPFYIYTVFFLVAYLENIIPPIWGDLFVAFGGYLAAISVISFIPVYLVTVIASVLGFMTVYWLGYHWGKQIENHPEDFWLLRFIPLKYIQKVRGWMHRWGQGVVVANRFISGARSVISLTAGISHTRPLLTAVSSTVSSLLWNAILLTLGYLVQQNWRIVGHYLSIYWQIIVGLILLVIIVRVGIYFYRKKRFSSSQK